MRLFISFMNDQSVPLRPPAPSAARLVQIMVPTWADRAALPSGQPSLKARRRRVLDIDRWVLRCALVVASPALDDDLCLAQSVENLAVEQLIAQAGIEALDVAVLSGTAPLPLRTNGALWERNSSRQSPLPQRVRV